MLYIRIVCLAEDHPLVQLCCREYIRIVCLAEDHPLVQLMTCTTRVGMRFCPLEYIRVMSMELERKMKGYVIKGCCTVYWEI